MLRTLCFASLLLLTPTSENGCGGTPPGDDDGGAPTGTSDGGTSDGGAIAQDAGGKPDAATKGDASTPTADAGSSASVPCALDEAAEACWQAHTGVQAGTGFTQAQIVAGQSGFTHHVGDLTITTPGTVIDHYYLEGCIAVKANNVTIKNTLIVTQDQCQGGTGGASSVISTGSVDATRNEVPVTGLTVSYVTLDASGSNGMGSPTDSSGIIGYNVAVDHLDAQGFGKVAFLLGNASMSESYLHNESLPALLGGTHEELLYLWDSVNIVLNHNYLHTQTDYARTHDANSNLGGVAAALFIKDDCGCGKNIVISNNYIRGDNGFDIEGSEGYQLPFKITGNALGAAPKYSKAISAHMLATATWTGNVDAETKAVISGP